MALSRIINIYLTLGTVAQDTWVKNSKGSDLFLCSGLAVRCNYFKAEGSFELWIIKSGKQNQGVFIKYSVLAWTTITQM